MNYWKQSLEKDDGKCLIECTVVSGFENEAADECFKKLGAKPMSSRGRIVFEMSMDEVSKVLTLKSVDNVYVVIKHVPKLGFTSDKAACLEKLNAIIDSCLWEKGLAVWKKVTGYDLLDISSITAGRLVAGDGLVSDGALRATQAGAAEGIQEKPVQSSAGPQTPDLLRDIAGYARQAAEDETPSANHEPQELAPVTVAPEEPSGGDSSNCEKSGDGDAENQPTNPETPQLPHHNFKFRVTCHRAGGDHSFGSPEAAIQFGSAVQTYFSWKPDMTQFDLEVMLEISTEQVHVSLALTRQSLHKRYITVFGKTTLRSTIAYNMLQMAGIRDGDVVCDPMCGTGVIPVEGALSWCNSTFLCGDIDPVAPEKTKQNVSNYNEELAKELTKSSSPLCLDIFQWDATSLPLKSNSIDVFVTDLPFGKRCGKKYDNRTLYPEILFEMARTASLNRGRAVVLSNDHRSLISALKKVARYWRDVRHLTINIGGLNAGVYYLERRGNVVYRGKGEGY